MTLDLDPGPDIALSPDDPPTPSSRGWPITALVALGFVIALVALGLATSKASPDRSPESRIAEPSPVRASAVPLENGYFVRRSFVGRVEARRQTPLGFDLGGLVESVTVEEGDRVDQGAVLATLDTARLRARRAALVAQVARAEAEVDLARATHARMREAQGLDAISSQALDEAALGLRAREAGLAEARAAVEQVDVELAKSRLRAPYAALVAARTVDEGQVVAPGAPVLRLFESTRPEARVGVAGDAIDALAPGQAVDVLVETGARGEARAAAGYRSVPATVRTLLPVRDRGSRSVDVILELDAQLATGAEAQEASPGPHRVRSGDLARLEVEHWIETEGFWLPTSALTESSRGLWAVYVVAPSEGSPAGGSNEGVGILERRELETLYEEADRVFARGTLRDGERVVTTGLHRLVPGQRVRVAAESQREPESPENLGRPGP